LTEYFAEFNEIIMSNINKYDADDRPILLAHIRNDIFKAKYINDIVDSEYSGLSFKERMDLSIERTLQNIQKVKEDYGFDTFYLTKMQREIREYNSNRIN
jgi:hypothetical protein